MTDHVVVIVTLAVPQSWQRDDQAAYGPWTPDDPRIAELNALARATGWGWKVSVLPLAQFPEPIAADELRVQVDDKGNHIAVRLTHKPTGQQALGVGSNHVRARENALKLLRPKIRERLNPRPRPRPDDGVHPSQTEDLT